ncbi:Small GTP-binding protein [Perilla frutescens var. hirtella]|nr:Small GTP-binding protein [Perilla frutescens var. hirtella]
MNSPTVVKSLNHHRFFPQFSLVGPLFNGFKTATSSKFVKRRRRPFFCQQNRRFATCSHHQMLAENEREKLSKKNGFDLGQFPPERIRNFSIVAHIDHGKSTLADRLLELTGTIQRGLNQPQYLDKLQVERQRGITVKAQTSSMIYRRRNKQDEAPFLLNLIDTPGHVDFSYEVSRSLAASQGVVLVVDAAQGVQAQTVANFYLASECNHAIIPVINKIDLPTADPDGVKEQLAESFDLDPSEALLASAKTGEGLEEILEAIVERIPPPCGTTDLPLRMLLFDSYYHEYKKVICNVAVIDGVLRKGDRILSAATGRAYQVSDVGIMHPEMKPTAALLTGQVGYVACGMYSTEEAHVGDTLHHKKIAVEPLPGFKPGKRMVFSGLYPAEGTTMSELQHAIEKLTCNDPSVSVEIESSAALGRGFSKVEMQMCTDRYKGKKLKAIWEPTVIAKIVLPKSYVGPVISLCVEREGEQLDFSYLTSTQAVLKYQIPLRQIIVDFYDILKSITSGYAMFMYEEAEYRVSNLMKLEALLNNEKVEAMATIVHKSRAESVADSMLQMLKKFIDRTMDNSILIANAYTERPVLVER